MVSSIESESIENSLKSQTAASSRHCAAKASSPPIPMEVWQRKGFESFGAWRRESERARRAAKKEAAAAAPRASPPSPPPPLPPPSPPPPADLAGAQLRRQERLHVAAARREKWRLRQLRNRILAVGAWRFLRLPRCGTCATCVELSRFEGSKHRASAPCETVLLRLNYTASERKIVCDSKQRFARGCGCGRACAGCGRKCERCHVCGRFW